MSNKATKSLSEQMAELDELLAWFDSADLDLDEALKKFDHGTELVEQLKARLGKLENKVTILKQKFDQTST